MEASPLKELQKIINEIHDQQFDVDSIRYDQASKILTLRFSREDMESRKLRGKILWFKHWNTPIREFSMSIEGVEQYQLHDPERIGTYQLNKLIYDSGRQELVLIADPKLTLRMEVRAFRIAITNTGKTLGEKTRYSLR